MSFNDLNGKYFWSNGYAYGICELDDGKVDLRVIEGKVELKSFKIKGRGEFVLPETTAINAGQNIAFKVG
jgi:hypothetical protein